MRRIAGILMIVLGALGLGLSMVDWRAEDSVETVETEEEANPADTETTPDLADGEGAAEARSTVATAEAEETGPLETDADTTEAGDVPPSSPPETAVAKVDDSSPAATVSDSAQVKVFEPTDPAAASDALPWVEVTPISESVNEDNGHANFVVTLSEPAESPIIIIFSTVNDTAESDLDYQSQRGMVTFKPGMVSAEIKTPLVDDQDKEDDEQFTIVLNGAPDVVNFKSRRATAIIKDND